MEQYQGSAIGLKEGISPHHETTSHIYFIKEKARTLSQLALSIPLRHGAPTLEGRGQAARWSDRQAPSILLLAGTNLRSLNYADQMSQKHGHILRQSSNTRWQRLHNALPLQQSHRSTKISLVRGPLRQLYRYWQTAQHSSPQCSHRYGYGRRVGSLDRGALGCLNLKS